MRQQHILIQVLFCTGLFILQEFINSFHASLCNITVIGIMHCSGMQRELKSLPKYHLSTVHRAVQNIRVGCGSHTAIS